MDGVHDLGGVEGFGPVDVEHDEPAFAIALEALVVGFGLTTSAELDAATPTERPSL
jgi:hypothetical protein